MNTLISWLMTLCFFALLFLLSCEEEKPAPAKREAPAVKTEEVKETIEPESAKLPAAPSPQADPAMGKEKFTAFCSTCHGESGKGDGPAGAALEPKPRDLTDSVYISTLSDDRLYKGIAEGGASVGKSPIMPGWKNALSKEEIWNVIAYIRTDLCKCSYTGN
ncbi:MAG: cytochrome c [Candidatus Dadabacteria bacterium]|nr:cytochrome c [Candidatus Dadabacteria bacterium]